MKYLKYTSTELTQNGLIDPSGRFFPCEFTGHNDLWDNLRENGLPEQSLDTDKRWIKVSTGIFADMTVFVMLGPLVTGRQKRVVEKIVEKFGLLKKKRSFVIVGYRDVLHRDENDKLKWDRAKE